MRHLDVLVLSDIHIGTAGSQIQNVVAYLKTVQPKKIILNGDIFDLWHFETKYWNQHCNDFINQIMSFDKQGIEIIYLMGNHDEFFRKFIPFKINNIQLENKYILTLEGKTYWCFHGDVFDVSMRYSKWIVRLGSWSYDLLIKLNLFLNTFAKWFNKDRFSLAQRVKMKFKSAVTFISKFEENIVGIAAEKDFDGVIVGHIHIPQIKNYKVNDKNIQYLNSGDCVENGTALEYHNCQWHLVYFAEKVQNKGN